MSIGSRSSNTELWIKLYSPLNNLFGQKMLSGLNSVPQLMVSFHISSTYLAQRLMEASVMHMYSNASSQVNMPNSTIADIQTNSLQKQQWSFWNKYFLIRILWWQITMLRTGEKKRISKGRSLICLQSVNQDKSWSWDSQLRSTCG